MRKLLATWFAVSLTLFPLASIAQAQEPIDRETIAKIPFDVVFADEAGLAVRATEKIDPALARAWDRALLDRLESSPHWSDSYGFMAEEAEELEPDPEADERGGGSVAAFIVATQGLRFWWD